MLKKIKKIGIAVTGLAIVGVLSVGLNSSFTYQAGHADTPAPQRPDLALNIGDTPAPADNRGDGGAPANADGNTGGIISNEAEGDTPAPQA